MSSLHHLPSLFGLIVGGVIGVAFGMLQNAALLRNEKRQQAGGLKSGWSLMPGSGVRVAYLLTVLAAVQVICPMLFVDGTQWWVSAGVIGGYGSLLYRQLRRRIKESRI